MARARFGGQVNEAARGVADYGGAVSGIKDNSSRHIAPTKEYRGKPPEFPISRRSVEKLCVGIATAERMQAIGRQAQRDFQFAMIYEQRKTNQILVEGFTNLADALDEMTWRITDSIDSLASSVDEMTSTLGDIHVELST